MLYISINKNGSDRVLSMEHSLRTISRWEAKYHKTFLSDAEYNKKTDEEMLDYISMMIQNYESGDIACLTDDDMSTIGSYMKDSRTSIRFRDSENQNAKKDSMTHEVIYYNMIIRNIPFECQDWHINSLFNLINVIDIKEKQNDKNSGVNNSYLNYHNKVNNARRYRR